MRSENILLIEELAANAWRPAVEQHVGGWRLRYTGGESRRVNSVWPNRPPGTPDLEAQIRLVEAFYRHHGTVPRYQICPAAQPDSLPETLASRGYIFTAHTSVKAAEIVRLLASTDAPTAQMVGTPQLTEEWFDAYTGASGYAQESLPIRRGILTRIGPPALFMLLKPGSRPAATGLGVVERGWLGVFCVVTTPESRRQGLATAIMHSLAEWGKSQGAEKIYLQVMEDNPPALALYDRLGFEKLYQYSYAEKR